MAHGGKPTEVVCSRCSNHELLLIPTCEEHKFCVDCILNCIKLRVCRQKQLGLRCPLSCECNSDLDKDLLQDVFQQLDTVDLHERNVLMANVDTLAESASKNACPIKNCQHSSVHDNGRWTKLFRVCSNCDKEICTTCGESLEGNGYNSHVCTPQDRTLLQLLKEELPKVLIQCTLPYCPNKNCKFFIDQEAAAVNTDGDYNAVQCHGCYGYYCSICSKDLGTDRRFEALKQFPHKNEAWPAAPDCWSRNERSHLQNTENMALHIRKIQGVWNVLKWLPESRREIYLDECQELLGYELYVDLKSFRKKSTSCVVM